MTREEIQARVVEARVQAVLSSEFDLDSGLVFDLQAPVDPMRRPG
jgi:hypothetical protein